ncbi:MAG: HAD family phosphatase [Deltaproteobacteria bacterium]|nr:HAD family phosphatase [Deltaproteobacteria bacterium]
MHKELASLNIRAVFTDLDDTLTLSSKIFPATYQALWRLKERGIWVVIVSGRPAGWADCLMRLWPLDAMVFENGAGIITREGEKFKTVELASDKNLADQQKILQRIFDDLKRKVPSLKLATDQPFRLFDFAIDYKEEPPRLSDSDLNTVLEHLRGVEEITAKLSSIHVNYWYGKHTKVTACEYLLQTEGVQRGIETKQVLFCGDSPNDEPLFKFFTHTVGVANIQPYLEAMRFTPRYVCKKAGGDGFVEMVNCITSTG